MNNEEFDAQVAVVASALPRYMEHLWDDFLPAREVHLLGGPSGSGKTTWLMQWLEQFAKGERVYDRATHPVPYIYITGDRSQAGMHRTLQRMKMDINTFPLYVPPRSHKTIESVLNGARLKHPEARLYIVEGFATWVPNGKISDYAVVSDYLKTVGAYCEAHNVTVIGVVHSPKMKEKERYSNPRDRVMGSSAWAAYTETVMLLEAVDSENEQNTERLLYLESRQIKQKKRRLDYNDKGRLFEVKVINNETRFDAFLTVVKPTSAGIYLFTTAELIAASGIKEGSVQATLDRAESKGVIAKVSRGNYKILKGQN